MPDFIGVYGFGMTRPTRAGAFSLHPCFSQFHEAKERAGDRRQFFLTAVGQIEGSCGDDSLSDLAAAMTFCQQQWVIVNGPFHTPPGTTLEEFQARMPRELAIPARRESGGALIMDDAFAPESRQQFLDLCLRQLGDPSYNDKTAFRQAFYRCVEVWRLVPAYVDVTYYLDFSALEILARTHKRYWGSKVLKVVTQLLKDLEFEVVDNDPSRRAQSIQTYVHLRNALLHNGAFEKRISENGREVVLELARYADYLGRLVPDVLLKVLGFDDQLINWNRWLDRQAFGVATSSRGGEG
jgi:hypothetical protein